MERTTLEFFITLVLLTIIQVFFILFFFDFLIAHYCYRWSEYEHILTHPGRHFK